MHNTQKTMLTVDSGSPQKGTFFQKPETKGKPTRTYADEYHMSPLPLRVRPCRWESLPSFLARSAARMQYEHIAHIIQPESSDYHIPLPAIALLAEQSDYRFLSDLLLLSEKQLYQMTLHRFVAPFQHVTFFPVSKSPQYFQYGSFSSNALLQKPLLEKWAQHNFFFPRQRTQICTLCLQEGVAYDRLYWNTRYMLTCTKHLVFLLRDCPTCQKPIPTHRISPTQCPFCHHSYHNPSSSPLVLPPETHALLAGDILTLQALGVKPIPLHPSCSSLEQDPRAILPPEQYFSLMRALCIGLHPLDLIHFKLILPPEVYQVFSHAFLPLQIHPSMVPPEQVALAHWIFQQWPHHFFIFLDGLEHWSWQNRKKHAFDFCPERLLLGTQAHEAASLLAAAYQQYQKTHG